MAVFKTAVTTFGFSSVCFFFNGLSGMSRVQDVLRLSKNFKTLVKTWSLIEKEILEPVWCKTTLLSTLDN